MREGVEVGLRTPANQDPQLLPPISSDESPTNMPTSPARVRPQPKSQLAAAVPFLFSLSLPGAGSASYWHSQLPGTFGRGLCQGPEYRWPLRGAHGSRAHSPRR